MSWKLVPDWPAREQIEAAYDQFGTEGPDPELVYRAMIAASPPPPDVIKTLESLLANACAAGETGPNGSVIVTATAKEWQDHVEATARARSVLAQLKGDAQ